MDVTEEGGGGRTLLLAARMQHENRVKLDDWIIQLYGWKHKNAGRYFFNKVPFGRWPFWSGIRIESQIGTMRNGEETLFISFLISWSCCVVFWVVLALVASLCCSSSSCIGSTKWSNPIDGCSDAIRCRCEFLSVSNQIQLLNSATSRRIVSIQPVQWSVMEAVAVFNGALGPQLTPRDLLKTPQPPSPPSPPSPLRLTISPPPTIFLIHPLSSIICWMRLVLSARLNVYTANICCWKWRALGCSEGRGFGQNQSASIATSSFGSVFGKLIGGKWTRSYIQGLAHRNEWKRSRNFHYRMLLPCLCYQHRNTQLNAGYRTLSIIQLKPESCYI